jgi:hypothetical protein
MARLPDTTSSLDLASEPALPLRPQVAECLRQSGQPPSPTGRAGLTSDAFSFGLAEQLDGLLTGRAADDVVLVHGSSFVGPQ